MDPTPLPPFLEFHRKEGGPRGRISTEDATELAFCPDVFLQFLQGFAGFDVVD